MKNEPDQDYRASGTLLVTAWLTHIAAFARRYDPHHLLTIGWTTPQAAETRIPGIDFVSVHYYAPAAGLASAYAALRSAVPGQPLVLEEFGLPTSDSFFLPNGHSEAEQAVYYATILRFLRTKESAGYLAWTLYDFSYVPSNVAGPWPWQTGPQRTMGVLRSNGSAKPAARLLAPDATLNVSPLPVSQSLLKSFWLMVSIVLLLGTASCVFVLKRLGRSKSR